MLEIAFRFKKKGAVEKYSQTKKPPNPEKNWHFICKSLPNKNEGDFSCFL